MPSTVTVDDDDDGDESLVIIICVSVTLLHTTAVCVSDVRLPDISAAVGPRSVVLEQSTTRPGTDTLLHRAVSSTGNNIESLWTAELLDAVTANVQLSELPELPARLVTT